MIEFDIDKDEFNETVAEVIANNVAEWAKLFTLVKIDVPKNAEVIRSTDHYAMLMQAIEKSGAPEPAKFLYEKTDPKETRIARTIDFATKTSYPAYRRKMAADILGNLITKFDKDGGRDAGFNNFVNTFFLNKKVNEYLYAHSKEFKDFADNINDVQVLDKFFEARSDAEYQKKVDAVYDEGKLNMICRDPLFKDTCICLLYADIFHKNGPVKS